MIKQLRVVATEGKTVNDVTPHTFRSVEEIDKFLLELRDKVADDEALLQSFNKLFKITSSMETAAGQVTIQRKGGKGGATNFTGEKIDPIFIRSLKKLQTSFDVVESLQEKADIIDSLEVQVNNLFKGAKGRDGVSKNLLALRRSIESKLEKAYDFLNGLGVKHEPAIFGTITGEIIEQVVAKVTAAKAIEDHDTFIYLTTKDDANGHTSLYFTKYLMLSNFRDDTGYVYPEYYIVMTAVVSPAATMTMHITTLSKWLIPGKFKLGAAFTNAKTGMSKVETILELENFTDLLSKVPMPVDSTHLKDLPKKYVSKVEVQNDIITVYLNAMPASQLDKAIADIYGALRAILLSKVKGVLRYRVDRHGKNKVLHFSLNLPEGDEARKKMITVDKLRGLSDFLDFDDDDIRNVVRLINK